MVAISFFVPSRPRIFLFFFLLPLPPALMEQPSIQDLSAPTGKFLEPPPSEYPILSSGYELCPNLIAMVREFSFPRLDGENPYHHLQEFEQMCSCYAFVGMTHDTFRWKLFPFSLTEEARQWYTKSVQSVNGSWSKPRGKSCFRFFPESRIVALRKDVLCFQ